MQTYKDDFSADNIYTPWTYDVHPWHPWLKILALGERLALRSFNLNLLIHYVMHLSQRNPSVVLTLAKYELLSCPPVADSHQYMPIEW